MLQLTKFATIAAFAMDLFAAPALATEYDLSAYYADPQVVANAVGSNDEALKAKLLGMGKYVADNGLEERFDDPSVWRNAVSDIVAGKIVTNAFANGFAVEMLLLAVAEPSEPQSIGWPFADLDDVSNYLVARGNTELADLLNRISWGNTEAGGEGLPAALAGKFGPTEYAARVSVFDVETARNLLRLMPQIERANAELRAFTNGDGDPGADAAKAAIEAAERKRWTEFFSQETNKEYLNGRTVEQAVAESIAQTLEDPYDYYDDLSSLDDARPAIVAWLEHAIAANKAIFFVYESS